MRIKLGNHFFDAKVGKETPVHWDTEQLINAHLLMLGASGVGKTHTLRKMIHRALAQAGPRVRFHVFDVHGDIDVPGASEVQFSESVPYGLNPLRVNPDPHFGGVRKAIQNFIRTLDAASTTPLGVKQEAVLGNVLVDVYREFEFDIGGPESWGANGAQARLVGGHTSNRIYLEVPFEEKEEAKALGARWDGPKRLWWCHTENYAGGLTRWKPAYREREYPCLRDVLEYAERVHLERFLGTDQQAIFALKVLNKTAKSYQNKLRSAASLARLSNGEFDVESREALEGARKEACAAFERYANSVQTGHELESLIKYDSPDVLKSTLNRLQNLQRTGIFKEAEAPFDPACPVWRYQLRALSQEEKKLFVLFRLQELFYEALQRGESAETVDIVVLDELAVYCTAGDADEGDGIIGTICREGRKFGLALWGAAQSPAGIPEGLMSSTATKLILGIDETYWSQAISKLRIEKNALEWIRAQSSMVVQMKTRGSLKNRWWWVNLEEGESERRHLRAV
ncbi:MAG: DUF5710 domain-containing protein [Steroidobacteraceae bacterium]